MGNSIAPAEARNYEEIYKNSNHIGAKSPVSSEVMTVCRMYVRLDDLDVKVLERAEEVKVLYVVADVVEVRGDAIQLPPSVQLIVSCRVLFFSSGNGWPQVALLQGPLVQYNGNYSPATGHWSATPLLAQDTYRFFLHGQELLILSGTSGRASGDNILSSENEKKLQLQSSTAPILPPRWVMEDPHVLSGLEASVITSELIVGHMTHAVDMVAEVRLHVEWLLLLLRHALDQTMTNAEANHLLRSLFFRVQSLVRMATAADNNILVVPRLQHHAYSEHINRLAELARTYDSDFKALTLFIQQNEILGSYLLEQNKAFAEKERDMEVVYTTLNEIKMSELIQALGQLERLGEEMGKMSEDMEQAREDMEKGLKIYRNKQVARAAFSLLNAIAQIGLAIFTAGATTGLAASAVANAGQAITQATEAAQQLRKIFETIEKMLLLAEVLVAMRDLLTAMNDGGELGTLPEWPEMPTTAEWEIFENEIEAVAAGMPEEVSETLVWKAKCKNVAAIGREMVIQAMLASQLEYDIKVHSLLQEVAQNQAARLEAIQPTDLIDYQEMAAQLDMRTSRILLSLLQVLAVQNGALTYSYLMPRTSLSGARSVSATMSAVWGLLLHQGQATLVALGELGSPSTRSVEYVVTGIPVGLLLDGGDWDFTIPVADTLHFPSTWSRVRISHVEMKFVKTGGTAAAGRDEELVHQPTTDTGEVYIVLRSELFFQDRRKGQNLMYEATVPGIYHYGYNLATSETTEDNRPDEEFARVFMRMTPFTRWKLRVSTAARENQGLAFPTAITPDATTQIAIRFYLSAIRAFDWNR